MKHFYMTQVNNPLHGIKLESLLNDLVDNLGWQALGQRINIRCFNHDPSIKSSLTFLRKNQWARDKVEALYLRHHNLPLAKSNKAKTSAQKPSLPPINQQIWGTKQPD